MANLTRINNNQITDAQSGNTQFGVNAAVKLQNYTVTSTKLANNLTYGSDLVITGNLTVNGNTTTIDTTIVTVEDPMISLAYNQTGTPTLDIGWIGVRGTSNNVAMIWQESSQQFLTAFTSDDIGNTTLSILGYADFLTANANVTGDLTIGGNIDITGNVTSLTVTGNISGGNLLTTGVASATGNVTGGNVLTGGAVSASGNVTGGNLLFGSGIVSGTGNIYADNIFANITGNIDAAGSNTQVQFNDGDFLGASSTFTFDKATNVLAVGGQITSTGAGNAATGGGQLYLNGATNNRIDWNTNGTGAPTFTTRSDGAKLVLFPNLGAAAADYALGIDSGVLWSGVPDASGQFKWYAGTTEIASLSGTGILSAIGNVSGANILTGGLISATGNITGGNVSTAGAITATGNITGGNIFSLDRISATGNITSNSTITGADILTGGVVSAVGNVRGGNINTVGFVSATGNITGGNIDTAGTVSATGNVTGGNVTTAGLVSATGNVYGDSIVANNGFFGNLDLTGNVVVNSLTSNTYVSATGNVISGNVLTGGYISATGNVTSGNIDTAGTITATGNIDGGNIATGGTVSATGNVRGGNINTAGLITATGNITGGNLLTGGLISAAGLATSGNVETAGYVSASGNIYGNAVVTTEVTAPSGSLTITSPGNILIEPVGNIVLANTYINNVAYPSLAADAASKEYVDNMVSSGLAFHPAVVVATTANLATTTGGTITYNQPNGAGNGIGATITTTGSFSTIDTANVQTAGTRILVKDEGNAVLNGVYVWSNATVITRSTDADQYGPNSSEELSLNDYFFVTSGNVNLGSAYVVDAPTGVITFGTSNINFAQFSQSQVYSANTAAGLVLIGQAFNAKVDNNTTAFDIGGNIVVKAGANLTTPNIGDATGTSINVTGNIQGGNILANAAVSATGNVVGGNITTVGLISATGNVTGNYIIGNGSQLTDVTASSVDANNLTGNTLASGVIFSSLTTVGTLTSLSVSGTTTTGNLETAGYVSATGNVTGGNVSTAGMITATGNIEGGNVTTAGLVSATGNIEGGNVTTAGLVSATGNVHGGNLITAGLISATGEIKSLTTITGGNLYTGGFVSAAGDILGNGVVSASGNITGGNLLFGSGIVSGTGNIYADNIFANITGNIDAAGSNTWVQFNDNDFLGASAGFTFDQSANLLTANGNIVGSNFVTTGLVTANGNVVGGNLVALGSVSAGGNVIGGNITTDNILSAGGNVTGGNVYTAGEVSAVGNLTSGNVNTTLVSASGNVVGGNIVTTGLITATGNIVGSLLQGGNIVISGDDITDTNGRVNINTAVADVDFAVNGLAANVFYVDAGANTASFGNSTQYTNVLVSFNSTNAIKLPVGTGAQQPAVGITGMLRFNTSVNAVEVFDNSEWAAVGSPVFTVVGDEQFNGDGSTVAFTLSSTQTTNSCIVSINGVVQIPTVAYSVAGTDPTCVLTFTEAPQPGDLIDVRQITTTTTVTSISNSSGNAVVAASDTAAQINVTGDLSVSGSILGGNINSTAITNGNSNVRVVSSGGNVTTSIAGTSNVVVVSTNAMTLTANVLPSANVTYDLGSTSQRWKDLWLSNSTIYLGNSQISANATSLIFTNPAGGQTVFAGASADITAATVSATGTITGGNLLTSGNVSATGNAFVNGYMSVTGNLYVANVVSQGNLVVTDPLLYLTATSTYPYNYDIGFYSAFTGGVGNTYQHTGFVRDEADGIWKLFSNVAEPEGSVIDLANAIWDPLQTGPITSFGNITAGNLTVTTGTITVGNIVNGNGNGVGNIGSSSTYFNTVFAKATSAQYADLAEKYVADAEYAPGTVVVFGGTHEVTVNAVDGDRKVAGVISTNPSYIMNGTLEAEYVATVALTGRVPCMVVGPVRKGDMMVAAGLGRARAEADPRVGTVIGKALEDFDGTEGTIEVVVGRF